MAAVTSTKLLQPQRLHKHWLPLVLLNVSVAPGANLFLQPNCLQLNYLQPVLTFLDLLSNAGGVSLFTYQKMLKAQNILGMHPKKSVTGEETQ